MSLEQQIATLVGRTANLLDEVAAKMAHIDQRVASKAQEVDAFLRGARGEFPLPPNLISNSFMRQVESGIPVGYSCSGCTIEAIHPFTKAFEAPYVQARPAGATSDAELATLANPFWFGGYDKGPRLGRGGLADGWGGIGGGHILKITAMPNPARDWTTVWFPMARPAATNQIGFRGFIKLVQGSGAGFGTDSGLGIIGPSGHHISKAQCDAAPQGWLALDFFVGTSQVTLPLSANFCLGFSRDEPVEAYLALPYAYIPAAARPGIVEN